MDRKLVYACMLRDANTLPTPYEAERWARFMRLERSVLGISAKLQKRLRREGLLPEKCACTDDHVDALVQVEALIDEYGGANQ